MGLLDWFSGKDNAPPEPLVMGAELKCPYGSSHSYLYLDTDDIDINNLPTACVEDCIAFHNVFPFGHCWANLGYPCQNHMLLADRWNNPEPQGILENGKEVITTKSTLICLEGMTEIKVVTSGQDGAFTAQLILYKEMEQNYPGLLAVLLEPYGSLYLNGDMYKAAFQFLEDQIDLHGGEIAFSAIYDSSEPEMQMIQEILGRLYPQRGGILGPTDTLEMRVSSGVVSGMGKMDKKADGPILDLMVLNDISLQAIRANCDITVEKIQKNAFDRWIEENRRFTSGLKDDIQQFICAAILGSAFVFTEPGPSGLPMNPGNAAVTQSGTRPSFEYPPITGIPGAGLTKPAYGGGLPLNNSWYNSDGTMNYPPNNGAVVGTEETITLKPGDTLGRYGDISDTSVYVTQPGADASELALPPNTDPSVYQEFEVIKEIPDTIQSEIAPWGDSDGGGIQYELPKPINQLITEGYIVPK